MASLEARREARRQKILQNSENRLRSISSPKSSFNSPEIGLESKPQCIARKPISETRDDYYKEVLFNNPKSEVQVLFKNPEIKENDSPLNCAVIDYFRSFKLWIVVILPLIVSYLIVLINKYRDSLNFGPDYVHLDKIFLPLLSYEIMELYLYPQLFFNETGALALILRLQIQKKPEIERTLMVLQCFGKIMQDLMIYFFVFTVDHYILNLLML